MESRIQTICHYGSRSYLVFEENINKNSMIAYTQDIISRVKKYFRGYLADIVQPYLSRKYHQFHALLQIFGSNNFGKFGSNV